MDKEEILYEHDFPKDWVQIAELDESADYEVDIIRIYKSKEQFILATASGCSCWDGDFYIERFKTLTALEESIGVFGDDREHQPSLKGAKKLIEEARKNISN